MLNKIYCGDSLSVLKTFPDKSIDMCITSPPYYGLRDYGVTGQLGMEKTVGEYVDNLVAIFTEVGRVLKDTGSLWVNLGDSYMAHNGTRGNKTKAGSDTLRGNDDLEAVAPKRKCIDNIPAKSLMLVPERFAVAMVDRGWICRNVIVWFKPSCLPESVKDRFTRDFEYLYFFVKKQKYYFERQFEPIKAHSLKRAKGKWNSNHPSIVKTNPDGVHVAEMGSRFVNPNGRNKRSVWEVKDVKLKPDDPFCPGGRGRLAGHSGYYDKDGNCLVDPRGRNKRAVWRINTKPFKGAHFATFPPRLIETPLKATCPKGGIVLDPFMGSGTTALVALEQGKNYVGIELNPEYIKMAEERIAKVQMKMF